MNFKQKCDTYLKIQINNSGFSMIVDITKFSLEEINSISYQEPYGFIETY